MGLEGEYDLSTNDGAEDDNKQLFRKYCRFRFLEDHLFRELSQTIVLGYKSGSYDLNVWKMADFWRSKGIDMLREGFPFWLSFSSTSSISLKRKKNRTTRSLSSLFLAKTRKIFIQKFQDNLVVG